MNKRKDELERELIELIKEKEKIENDSSIINMFKRTRNKIKKEGFLKFLLILPQRLVPNFLKPKRIASKFTGLKNVINSKKIIKKQKSKLIKLLIKNKDKKRLIIWYSEIGWNIPLFQRPNHLFRCFSQNQENLVFYQSSEYYDGGDYLIKEQEKNLYLINFMKKLEIKIFKIIAKHFSGKKYVYIPSTSFATSLKTLKKIENMGYEIVYDYIDDLSPAISNSEELPQNITDIHNYVMKDENILTICTATILYNDSVNKRGKDKNIIFACNAVDYDHFTKLTKKVNLSKDFKAILKEKKPIIGYYGAIATWFDYETLINVAKKCPEYNFVLIGPEYDSSVYDTELYAIDNIHMLGPKKFDELPYYAEKFDVFMLPFLINDVTNATNPIKIFEYMAMEKPIITSDLPECRKYKSCLIYKNDQEFIKLIDKSLKKLTKEYRETLKKEALENTWEKKADTIMEKIVSKERGE